MTRPPIEEIRERAEGAAKLKLASSPKVVIDLCAYVLELEARVNQLVRANWDASAKYWIECFSLAEDRDQYPEDDNPRIANELADFHHLMREAPKVYYHVTGGRMSKPMYYAEDVNALHDTVRSEEIEEILAEETEILTTRLSFLEDQNKRLREALGAAAKLIDSWGLQSLSDDVTPAQMATLARAHAVLKMIHEAEAALNEETDHDTE